MKVLLNTKELDIENSNNLSKTEVLYKVREKLEDEIIEKIYLDDLEVNLEYFNQEDLKVSEIDIIKFTTKKTEELVKETLLEAQDYLPRLKEGLLDTAALFSQGKIVNANNKLKLCLDGIEWYTGIINNIINLINEENKIIKTELEDFNKTISWAMIALQNDNYDYLADMLEVKVIEFIDRFIGINEKLLSDLEQLSFVKSYINESFKFQTKVS